MRDGDRLSTGAKAVECGRCGVLIERGRIRAILYSRSLCTKCWDAWRTFGFTAFKLWMGETEWSGSLTSPDPETPPQSGDRAATAPPLDGEEDV